VLCAGCLARKTADSAAIPKQLPADKVAVVRVQVPSKLGRARVETLDGYNITGRRDRLEVLAGAHTVELSFIYGEGVSAFTSEANCPLSFTAVGGHVYIIRGEVGFKNRVWTATVSDLLDNVPLDQCKTKEQEGGN